MTKVVCITGGIGSGKTTLSEYLKKKGYLVHESDKIVAEMYQKPETLFKNYLKKNISKEVVKNGRINKKKVSNIIFNNSENKKILEKFIHKQVERSRNAFIKKNHKNKKKIIFVDIPLLFENKLEKKFDFVVCIISTKKNREKRILQNKKFSQKTLRKIFKFQTNDKHRRSGSDIIINNNRTKKDFIFAAEKALLKILK